MRRRAVVAAVLCAALSTSCAPRTGATTQDLVTDASVGSATGPAERADARPSPGCFAQQASSPPERLVVDGRERALLTRVPDGRANLPRDLVIAFHGRTNDAGQARRYFHLDRALPAAVIVYASALRTPAGTFAWSDPGDAPERLRDFALVHRIIDAFGRDACLDLDRVFVVGHSLGASFANDVACRLGARVRAVASVAGALQGSACVGGTAALIVHHPDDRLVDVGAGERAREAFRVAVGLADAPPVAAPEPALAALRCVRYGGDGAENPVVWCPHDDDSGPGGRYYPHTWPDGTAAAIAAFFAGLP
jgi:polyhydroxybutyrate depolymerase